jgi:rubrerythrin
VLRDAAYKIGKLADDEREAHIRKGWWQQTAEGPAPAVSVTPMPHGKKAAAVAAIKGTQTEKNLLTAFAGESQACNRYTYFSNRARKEGFVQIANIFEKTANQEKEHAERFFSFLEGGETEIHAAFPAGVVGDTLDNLRAAAAVERYEHAHMYPGFAAKARQEGFGDIAAVFENVAVAEKQHEKRYLQLAENIEAGRVFKRVEPAAWCCRNCGFVLNGPAAPERCPACAHPRAHFELLGENW